MSAMSNEEITKAMGSVLLSPPDVSGGGGLMNGKLSNPGHASPLEYSTDPSPLATYGISSGSMGNPLPFKDSEKGTIPLIPNETLIEQMRVLTARVAEQIEPPTIKQKVCF
jgi:hypothetical protein